MITLEVVNVSGMSPPQPMVAEIDERGGTLGRSPDCTLVLADDKRAVSRVHGQIICRNGQFLIEDQGTNPLKVNGAPVGKGNSVAIKGGDRIVIGPYELEVRGQRAAPARAAAPVAPSPGWEPADWTPDAPAAAAPRPASSGSGNPFDDLFGSGSSPDAAPSSGGSPFDDLGFGAPPPAAAKPTPGSRAPAAASSFGALPDDFDPMAPPPSAADPMPPAGAGLPDDAFGELLSSPHAPGSGSLDEMFGLSSGASSDPFASTPLGAPPPSHAGGTDSGLTQWIGGINKAAAAPISDKVPELNSAFQPPKAVTPAAKTAAPLLDDFAAPSASKKDAAIPPAGELPDFDLDAFGSVPATPPPAAAVPPPRAAPAPRPPPRAAAPAPAARVQTSGPSAPPSDLLQALMSGLNAPDLSVDELTPDLMYKLGALMHEATAGTIALLNARGSVKREMRADVTMIASGRNNPLKFSPDAGLALRYLFGPPMPGFMEAEDAMRDAYSDLRAHEFGFMAGLRAALAGVLKRFEPGVLESRLPDKGGLNALVPMNRKAKLWDQFGELYRQISMEAEEDFHALFGREFLRAYEEHIAALERGQQRRK